MSFFNLFSSSSAKATDAAAATSANNTSSNLFATAPPPADATSTSANNTSSNLFSAVPLPAAATSTSANRTTNLFGAAPLPADVTSTSASGASNVFAAASRIVPTRGSNVFNQDSNISGGASIKSAKTYKKSSKTPAELKKWFRRCRKKHMVDMTPLMMERMKQTMRRQNREQRKHRLTRKCKKMAFASATARSSAMSSIATYSPHMNQMQSVAQKRQVRARASATMKELSVLQAARLSESESEDEIDMLEQRSAVATASVTDETARNLLDELKTEPTDDTERADKFKVYEEYSNVVTKSREECSKFHDACKEDLKEYPHVLSKMARTMASIDSDHNRSINWDNLGNRWFVYDMSVQSDHNNKFIGNIFTGLKRDLEMVQDNDMDCPICLENLKTIPSGVRVLHCCHKLCGDCYDSWKAVCRGGHLICPLCRQRDFQAAVVTRAPTFVQQYLHDMASDSDESDTEVEPSNVEAVSAGTASSSSSSSSSSSTTTSTSTSSSSSSSSSSSTGAAAVPVVASAASAVVVSSSSSSP